MRSAADQSPGEKIWPVPKFLSDSFDPLPHFESDPGIVLECARNRSRRDTRYGSNINNRDFHRGTGWVDRDFRKGARAQLAFSVRTFAHRLTYWDVESKRGGLAQVLCDRLHEYEIFIRFVNAETFAQSRLAISYDYSLMPELKRDAY